jgi:hypothetical protein
MVNFDSGVLQLKCSSANLLHGRLAPFLDLRGYRIKLFSIVCSKGLKFNIWQSLDEMDTMSRALFVTNIRLYILSLSSLLSKCTKQ